MIQKFAIAFLICVSAMAGAVTGVEAAKNAGVAVSSATE